MCPTLVAALLALSLVATGCSILGDSDESTADGDAANQSDGAEVDSTASSDSLTATTSSATADGSTSSDQDADPSTSASTPTSTLTSAPVDSPTTESTASVTTVDPVFEAGFCDAPESNRFEIKFEPGAVSSVVDSATVAGQVDLYEIEVGADQIMVITLGSSDSDAVATLYRPDGTTQPEPFTDTSVVPTLAGSYWICVTAGSDGADYQLSVSVIDDNTPTKISAPWCGDQVNDRGEIEFEAGRFGAEVDNAVIRGERDLYTITANEGQAIDLFLASPEFNAVFDFRSPSGEIIIDEVSDFRIPLPETGTYEICIGGTRGNAAYVLDVSIG